MQEANPFDKNLTVDSDLVDLKKEALLKIKLNINKKDFALADTKKDDIFYKIAKHYRDFSIGCKNLTPMDIQFTSGYIRINLDDSCHFVFYNSFLTYLFKKDKFLVYALLYFRSYNKTISLTSLDGL